MAIADITPTCIFCGKPTMRAIHKDESDLPITQRTIGNTIIGYEPIAHDCDIVGKFKLTDNERLTERQQWILSYLKSLGDDNFISPTQIGRAYGEKHGKPNMHSSTASPPLKRLVEKGLVLRNEKGHYKIAIRESKTVSELLTSYWMPMSELYRFNSHRVIWKFGEFGLEGESNTHISTGYYMHLGSEILIDNPDLQSFEPVGFIPVYTNHEILKKNG